MSNTFSQSPYFIVEEALERYFEEALDLKSLLDLVASQHSRVMGWLKAVESLEPSDCRGSHRMKELGLRGNSLMLEGLALMHEAVQQDDQDDFQEAEELLQEGHDLIEESLHVSDEVEVEESRMVMDTLDDYPV